MGYEDLVQVKGGLGLVEGRVTPSKSSVRSLRLCHVCVNHRWCCMAHEEVKSRCCKTAGSTWPQMALEWVLDHGLPVPSPAAVR